MPMNLRFPALVLALGGLLPGASGCARAQEPARASESGSPAWVVEMFYARPTFPLKAKHITGEYAANYADAPTMGSRLPPTVAVTSRPLLMEPDRAAFATSLRDASHAEDWYTFLRREGGVWKIEAVRTLALPPIHYMLLDSMEAKRARGELPDSLVPMAETMRLAAQPDSALKAHLLAHQADFRALAERFAASAGIEAVAADGAVSPAGAMPEAERRAVMAGLRALRLGAVFRLGDVPRCIFLKIGGAGDNQVGYIHAPPVCTPPPLSPGGYIYVEPVAPGWFVYKTT
jgi:hypothetical protein